MKPQSNWKRSKEIEKRVRKILPRLRELYPDAQTALHYSSPLDLLVATILSAQCTDERVNLVTRKLFSHYRTAQDYAHANIDELQEEIRSTGFYRAKAKSIISCCRELVERHNGQVPDSIAQLVELPGVGRKTANVVLGTIFRKSEGIVVDTHVKRLAGRLELSRQSDPEKIEQDLMKIVPKRSWILFSDLLVWHGRKICQARTPYCNGCVLNDICPSARFE